jgi:predicted ribosome-associated RNA-binding protein Tma20
MCPGLTHPNASLVDAEVGDIVAIMAEGKKHALAIGQMKMSTADMCVFRFKPLSLFLSFRNVFRFK